MRRHIRTVLDRALGATSSDRETGAGNGTDTGRSSGSVPSSESDDGSSQSPILTNEEHVLRVLSAYDGKIWQNRIVDETGWSKSKVSRVLSEMEADETVRRRRVGRRKVVYLPEVEPDFLSSPETDGGADAGTVSGSESTPEPELRPNRIRQ